MQGQLATAWPPTRGRPAAPEGAATHRGDACGQKCCLQGLPSPTTNRGSAAHRPVRRGATPVEVPPARVEPIAGAATSGQ
ncbi:hypothetical protein GW17_00055617, partial [Ensete ventricosum]